MIVNRVIYSHLEKNKGIIVKNMTDCLNFDKEEVVAMYEDLINNIDYRISEEEFLPVILDLSISFTDGMYLQSPSTAMLLIAEAIISASKSKYITPINLLYGLVDNLD